VNEAKRKSQAKSNSRLIAKMEWSGSFENARRASQQLLTIVPLVCFSGCCDPVQLVQFVVGDSVLILEIPFSALGAIFA